MTTPIYRFEVDWDNDGDFEDADENITADVLTLRRARRGRNFASALSGRSQPGEMSLLLANRDGRYSHFNTTGPLFGDLLQQRRVRYKAGLPATAAKFLGANQYLSIADNAALSTGDIDFTVAMWAQLTANPGNMGIFGKWGGPGNLEYIIHWGSGTGQLSFHLSDNGTNNASVSAPATEIKVGNWYLVIAWHDAAANTRNIQIDDTATTSAVHSTGVFNSTAPLNIGRNDDGDISYLNGLIGPIGFWKRTLTALEKTWLFNNGYRRLYAELGVGGTDGANLLTNLQAYWNMQEAGGTRTDSHGANHLTDNNTVLTETQPSHVRWTGFLKSLDPQWGPGQPVAELIAEGPLARVAAASRITTPINTGALTGTIVGSVLDEIDWPAADREIDAGQTITGPIWFEEKDPLEALKEIEDTELGFLREGRAWDLIYEDRERRQSGAFLTSQVEYSDAVLATNPYLLGIRQLDPSRDLWNEVKATVQYYLTGALAVLWTLQEAVDPTLVAGQTRTYWAVYLDGFVNPWTTPVVGTDIVQSGVANGDIAVVATKFAQSMKIEITNNHASATATLTLVQARGIPVTPIDPTRVSSEDAASQSEFGRRTYPLPAKWLRSTNDAQDLCDAVVLRYKDPRPPLRLPFVANLTDELMLELMNREISDRVTVEAQGILTQLGVMDEFHIEGLEEAIDFRTGLVHNLTFDLSPAFTGAGFWVLGISELDVSTVLGY